MESLPQLTRESLQTAQPTAASPQIWRLMEGGTVELRRDANGRARLSLNYNRHDLTEQESVLVCQLIDVATGVR